jgi:hypothetical protein
MFKILIAIASVLFAVPAAAWDFDEKDGQCSVSQTFEGPGRTMFAVWQDQEDFDNGDRVMVLLQNDNWTTGSDSMVGTVRFETDEGWFENNAVGFETETLPGVIALSVSFENANIALESRPNWLHVTRAGQTIDRLSLTGFSYYWSRFTRCRAAKQAVVNERQRQEKLRNTIPINPFG